jgi:hypothetical protein
MVILSHFVIYDSYGCILHVLKTVYKIPLIYALHTWICFPLADCQVLNTVQAVRPKDSALTWRTSSTDCGCPPRRVISYRFTLLLITVGCTGQRNVEHGHWSHYSLLQLTNTCNFFVHLVRRMASLLFVWTGADATFAFAVVLLNICPDEIVCFPDLVGV